MNCNCQDWKENIAKVNAPLMLQAARSGFTKGSGYNGEHFRFCPWCSRALDDSQTPSLVTQPQATALPATAEVTDASAKGQDTLGISHEETGGTLRSCLQLLNAPQETLKALEDGDLEHVTWWVDCWSPMPPLDIDKLVTAFLSWPLPNSVCSDQCATTPGQPHRSGTNLLSADEARQMFLHVLAQAKENQ